MAVLAPLQTGDGPGVKLLLAPADAGSLAGAVDSPLPALP